MGAITQAMDRAAQGLGVEIRTGCAVDEVLLEKGRAGGVVTAKGERLDARVVVLNLNPRLLYTKLVDPGRAAGRFFARDAGLGCGSGTFRMNVALSELPSFGCLPGKVAARHHGSGIIIGALGLDQLFAARPMLGHADYRGPVARLYICGSGTHPGGGVTGAPGHNAAREVLREFANRNKIPRQAASS